jgi:hypothetical protein
MMPQFDIFSFFSQLFWVFIGFCYLYTIICFYVLPAFAAVLKVRSKKLTQTANVASTEITKSSTTNNSSFFEDLVAKTNNISFSRLNLTNDINGSFNFLILKNDVFFKFNFSLLKNLKIVTLFYK